MQSLVFKMYIRSLQIVAETNASNLCQGTSKEIYKNIIIRWKGYF